MNIDKLYNDLINLQYEDKGYDSRPYKRKVINEGGQELFRVALADALSGQFNEYEAEIAKLEAKVYAYEAIIANSNFKPVLESQDKVSQDDGSYIDTTDRDSAHWIMKHRTYNSNKSYTGIDESGEEHTVFVHEVYECDEPYCSKCGKQAGDTSQNFCCYCGAAMPGMIYDD